MSAKKKISQETFDEVVEENIVDFEMSKEEALADTIKQFQSQGVDLSGLDTSGGIGRQELLDHISTLQSYVLLSPDVIHQEKSVDDVVNAMNALCKMCAKNSDGTVNEYALRNQTMMRTNGGLTALQNLLKVQRLNTTVYTEDPDTADTAYPFTDAVYAAAIRLQTTVMKTNVENRDYFEPWGSVLFVHLITRYQNQYCAANPVPVPVPVPAASLQESSQDKQQQHDVCLEMLLDAYRCCRLASKTEYNKATLMKKGLDGVISQWLTYMVARASVNSDDAGSVTNDSAEPVSSVFTNMTLSAAVTTAATQQQQATSTPAAAESYRLLSEVTSEVCFMLRSLTVHDDDRKDMSCAYENGKKFMASNTSNDLLALAKLFYAAPTEAGINIATAALFAAKQLITSEESVQIMSKHGAMELPLAIFSRYISMNDKEALTGAGMAAGVAGVADSVGVSDAGADTDASVNTPARTNLVTVQLLRATAGVMRNLCADDVRKDILVKDGTLRALQCVLNSPECLKDLNFVEQATGCLAMITLRAPHNSVAILSSGCGTAEAVLKAMHYHMNKHRMDTEARGGRPSLQGNPAAFLRQGCLFFRNIAARCPELREDLLKTTNVEQILKQVGTVYTSCVDEAYGALRDFHIEIKRVNVNAVDGSTSALYDTFGEGTKKSGFNPVFDNSNNLSSAGMQARIADNAQAPFAGSAGGGGNDSSVAHVHGVDCNH